MSFKVTFVEELYKTYTSSKISHDKYKFDPDQFPCLITIYKLINKRINMLEHIQIRTYLTIKPNNFTYNIYSYNKTRQQPTDLITIGSGIGVPGIIDHSLAMQSYGLELSSYSTNKYSHIDVYGICQCPSCHNKSVPKLATKGILTSNVKCQKCGYDLLRGYFLQGIQIYDSIQNCSILLHTFGSSRPINKNSNILQFLEKEWPDKFPNISNYQASLKSCPICKGTGVFISFQWSDPCDQCNGSGYV